MYGSKLLFKQFVRQFICEIINVHNHDSEHRPIALVGSRRSGSTLLMQCFGSANGIKVLDQPFSQFGTSLVQRACLPLTPSCIYLGRDESLQEKLDDYVELILSGEVHINESWRFWQSDFQFRSNRVLLKTTDALIWKVTCVTSLISILLDILCTRLPKQDHV